MSLNALATECYQHAINKGFAQPLVFRNPAELIALMHLELSETLEAIRKGGGGGVSEKIPEFTCEEEEMADVIIRVLDYAGERQLDMDGAIAAKRTYNDGRPFKHGKAF